MALFLQKMESKAFPNSFAPLPLAKVQRDPGKGMKEANLLK
jgi:hypothetical protein